MQTQTKRQQFWQSHLDQLQASGLSVKAYAEQHDLKVATLYAYRKRLRHSDKKPPRFVQATVTRSVSLPCRVHLRNGVIVEINTDGHAVDQLLTTLASLS